MKLLLYNIEIFVFLGSGAHYIGKWWHFAPILTLRAKVFSLVSDSLDKTKKGVSYEILYHHIIVNNPKPTYR